MVYAADLGSVATSVEVRILSKAFYLIVQKNILPSKAWYEVKVTLPSQSFDDLQNLLLG